MIWTDSVWSLDECKGQTLFSKAPAGVVNLLSFPVSSWGFPDGRQSCSPYSLVLMKIKELVGKVLLLTLGKRSQEAFKVFSFSAGQMGQHAEEENNPLYLGVIFP